MRDSDQIPLQESASEGPRGAAEDRTTEKEKARALIRHHARLLAAVCALCWVSSLLVFVVTEALHHDVTYDSTHEARPSNLDLHLLSGAAALVFLTGPLGLWASLHLQHDILCFFTCVMFVGSVSEVCVGAVLVSFRAPAFHEDVLKHVKTDIGHREFIFNVQRKLACCGSSSPEDWVSSAWWEKHRRRGTAKVVPHSCCIPERKDKEYKICNIGQPPDYTKLLYPHLVHNKGCRKRLIGRRDALMATCGYVVSLCGLLQLMAFFVTHYVLNRLLPLQKEWRRLLLLPK